MESQSTNELKEGLQELLAEGKTGQVLQLLLEVTRQLRATNLREEVILHASSYKASMASSRQGTTTRDVHDADLKKINLALLGIIGELPDSADAESVRSILKAIEQSPDEEEVKARIPEMPKKQFLSPKMKGWRSIIGVSILIGILVGITKCPGYGLEEIFEPKLPDQEGLALILILHGPNGTGNHINDLKGKAEITIDFGDHTLYRKTASDDGKVYFEGIPKRLRDSSFEVRLAETEDYLLAYPDSSYILNNNFAYIEVYRTKRTKKEAHNSKNNGETAGGKEKFLPAEIGSVTIKLSGKTKKYKFLHASMKNPEIVLEAKIDTFTKVGGGEEFTIISLPIEVKHIESLKFIEGNTICTFQGTLHESKDTYSTNCE